MIENNKLLKIPTLRKDCETRKDEKRVVAKKAQQKTKVTNATVTTQNQSVSKVISKIFKKENLY